VAAAYVERTITRTERAKAADDEVEDSEESSSEDGDMYISSDEDSVWAMYCTKSIRENLWENDKFLRGQLRGSEKKRVNFEYDTTPRR
jgi:hypothetical protein